MVDPSYRTMNKIYSYWKNSNDAEEFVFVLVFVDLLMNAALTFQMFLDILLIRFLSELSD